VAEPQPILQIEDLRKNFGALAVTDGITLDVRPNELHAIIGPNGAGKTTLINQISGFLTPASGRILFEGRDITALPVHVRAGIGLARTFQVTSILAGFSALENVAIAVQARAGSSFRFFGRASAETSLNDPAREVLQEVGLGNRACVPAGELSHGEKRALELAIALAMGPKLLLLDEPMAGVNPTLARSIEDDLAGLAREGLTLLLVEHELDVVERLSDSVIAMSFGKVIATGTMAELRSRREVLDAYLGD